MVGSAALLAMNDAVSKFLSETYPVGQILGLRHTVALLIILAYVHWDPAGRRSG